MVKQKLDGYMLQPQEGKSDVITWIVDSIYGRGGQFLTLDHEKQKFRSNGMEFARKKVGALFRQLELLRVPDAGGEADIISPAANDVVFREVGGECTLRNSHGKHASIY